LTGWVLFVAMWLSPIVVETDLDAARPPWVFEPSRSTFADPAAA
jgi:hypothetical protein